MGMRRRHLHALLAALALVLMVGIVIDDAIIVLENIFRFIEEKNMPPFQAAIQGTKEIGLAVMATIAAGAIALSSRASVMRILFAP